jgi:hypothetical protein
MSDQTRGMFAVCRLPLRDPRRPPQATIARMREALPDVEIGADGQALVFMAEDPDLDERVRSAVARACGDWRQHFHSLDTGPEPV